MKKYTSPAIEEIKLTGIETITDGAGQGNDGNSGVISGDR